MLCDLESKYTKQRDLHDVFDNSGWIGRECPNLTRTFAPSTERMDGETLKFLLTTTKRQNFAKTQDLPTTAYTVYVSPPIAPPSK